MTSLMPGAGLLPIPTPNPLTTLGVSLSSLGAIPAAALDPNIATLGEIPQPPLMGNVDPSKIDEIRRTVYVGNLNSQTTTADQLLEFFKQVGEVKFVRMAGDETQPTRFAFVEFADQNSVPRALAFNGVMFGDRPLKINHSNNAIVKPPEMTPQAAAKELEEVMKRVREAQSFISAAIEPGKAMALLQRDKRKDTREKIKEKERVKEKDREKEREKERDREKEREKEKERGKNKDKDRDKEREKDRDKDKDKEKDKERERDKDHEKERDKEKEKEQDKEKEREKDRSKETDEKRKKDKKSRTPPRSYNASRRSRSSSSRNKKDKKREKEKDHISERRERERSASTRKNSNDREGKDKVEKNNTSLKEKEHNKEPDSSVGKEVDGKDAPRTEENRVQQNGNCQPNEESLSAKAEAV
uniref:Splicing regulatory glutamine/lysine-rich protein 1 n=1 Tax=Capra hircus TaxID=9925 RepID=A0A452EGB8_CAPHI